MEIPMSSRMLMPMVVLSLVTGLAPIRPGHAADTYTADATHSSTVFRVKHMNASYAWGRFNSINGSFTLDEASPAQSKFEFQVKADSIDTANAKRDQHLKSPDFFNAVQFPSITFKSQSVAKSGAAYDVTGDLTLHGVTRPVTLKVTPTGTGKGPNGASIAGIEATLSIKRSDFGMDKMVGPVGDDVTVMVSIEGMKR
jgi:polyisoprenoid-binding protein YceI